ncbi:protein jagged-1-like isoform X2 [Daktulosphaira vitifoliae]|uniref:protein jagged-1-like isoform X2 n=1 Tax=Daktulosphaira vitifoliae TaxID=58002 RepID=UPI0021AA9495|nr:protein jagged-1-like isoform X2 [Daktulosphaira vitifoliae]
MAETASENAVDKWVWRPRWPPGRWGSTSRNERSRCKTAGRPLHCRPVTTVRPVKISWLFLIFTFLLLMIRDARALGFFELQILEIENYRGQLATGECCGSSAPISSPSRTNCIGAPQCNTLFRVCLREYQSRPPAGAQPSLAVQPAATAPVGSTQLQCSFGNTSSPVLGGNSFTLTDSDSSDSRGHLSLPFSFSWTRSFTFILQAMDYNNYTGSLSVIEEATYSGILLPGNEWKALSHLGHTARMAYRVRVQCDRYYYGQTCTKLCKPRDDRFGHYTCGDTDGRKECIPGWQGENCDKAVCKTGCHPVHGKCDYPGGCECRKGWQGELCDQCMTYPGCKHGYCNGTSWQCICDINWGGILCDQDLNYCGTHEPCLNGGTCKSTAPDRYTCTCPEGFSGSNCDVVLNPCATEPCLNGGKCTTMTPTALIPSASGSSLQLLPKQFHCECQSGWTGSTCNTDVEVCENQLKANNDQTSCGVNAIFCKSNTTDNSTAQCVCRKGWTNAFFNENSNNGIVGPSGCPVNIDDCAVLVGEAPLCKNGGTCVDLVGSYVCNCPVGYTGQHCQTQIDPCDSLASANPCKNGGECVRSQSSFRSYSCICPLGYSGDECEINRDHCAPNPCRNGGQCLNTPDDYYCHCVVATDGSTWHGKNCTIPRKRVANPAVLTTTSVQPTTVIQQIRTKDFQDQSYYYYNNNLQTCADSNLCLNGGTCVLTALSTENVVSTGSGRRNKPNSFYKCICSVGYHGHHCEIRLENLDFSKQHIDKRPTQSKVEYQVDEGDDVVVDNSSSNDDVQTVSCTELMLNKHWPSSVDSYDKCNECRCIETSAGADDDDEERRLTVQCTNLWCGPKSCFEHPCTGNQICVPVEETTADTVDLSSWKRCLRPPCAEEAINYNGHHHHEHKSIMGGRCVSNGEDIVTSIWPLSVRHCWPNYINGAMDRPIDNVNGCGRMSLTLDTNRLRRGTNTAQVCHNLRRLISLSWVMETFFEGHQSTPVYIMCEAQKKNEQDHDIDDVVIQIFVAIESTTDKSGLVQRTLNTLHKLLLNQTSDNKKGHREELFSAVSLTAAVVKIDLQNKSPVSPQYSETLNDYQYYYWTGVACGALAILIVCVLLRFGYQHWKNRNGNSCSVISSGGNGKSNTISNQTSNSNNNLILLVQRQNEENLRRYSAVTANSNKLNSGSLNSVNGALTTSSLNCSRISIVHPLCQQSDGILNQQQQQHQVLEIYDQKNNGMDIEKVASIEDKIGADNSVVVKPSATMMVAPPQHIHQIPLCKKTQNTDQQHHYQQQHQVLVHPQQPVISAVQHNNMGNVRSINTDRASFKNDQTLTALI